MDDRVASLDSISRAMLQAAAADGHIPLWRLRRIGHFATDMQTLLHIHQTLNPGYQHATGHLGSGSTWRSASTSGPQDAP